MSNDVEIRCLVQSRAPWLPASFGQWLIADAGRGGLTPEALAERADLTMKTLTRLAAGGHTVSAATKVCRVLIALGRVVPPMPIDEMEWSPPPSIDEAPLVSDPEAERLRKNLIRARQRARYKPIEAADEAHLPFETLLAYEAGSLMVPGIHLKVLAELYGYVMDDLVQLELPPPRLDKQRRIEFSAPPGTIETMTPEHRAWLDRLITEAGKLSDAVRLEQAAEAAPKRMPPKPPKKR